MENKCTVETGSAGLGKAKRGPSHLVAGRRNDRAQMSTPHPLFCTPGLCRLSVDPMCAELVSFLRSTLASGFKALALSFQQSGSHPGFTLQFQAEWGNRAECDSELTLSRASHSPFYQSPTSSYPIFRCITSVLLVFISFQSPGMVNSPPLNFLPLIFHCRSCQPVISMTWRLLTKKGALPSSS